MSQAKPQWHGVLLVAGGAVGAGMFALPMVSAGAWLLWSVVGLVAIWLMTYLAASVFSKITIALVNSTQNSLDEHSSFSSIISHVLGGHWARLNNTSIIFIMMILMYAYTTAGASILTVSGQYVGLDLSSEYRPWLSTGVATIIGLIVWLGVSWVSRITLWLMVVMAIVFVAASIGIYPLVDFDAINQPLFVEPVEKFALSLGALPVYATAFACAGLIPSLVRHYQSDSSKVLRSLFLGTFLAFAIYLVWLVLTLGSIGRDGFVEVISTGGNIGELVSALVAKGMDPNIEARLTLFSHIAILTSFLSVGVGLLHFIQDRLKLGESAKHRFVAALICFAPPALMSFFLPYGFVHAIGFAGLFVAFSFFVIPGVVAFKVADVHPDICTDKTKLSIIVCGVIIFALKLGLIFSILPSFP
jgi:tryptophan-specific transport protein